MINFILTILISVAFTFNANACVNGNCVGTDNNQQASIKSTKNPIANVDSIITQRFLVGIEKEEEEDKLILFLTCYFSFHAAAYNLEFNASDFYFSKNITPLVPWFILLEVFRI